VGGAQCSLRTDVVQMCVPGVFASLLLRWFVFAGFDLGAVVTATRDGVGL